jgi:DnaJ-class molecular chaperone
VRISLRLDNEYGVCKGPDQAGGETPQCTLARHAKSTHPTHMASEIADPYELLGISSDATIEVINKAFRQRSLKVHPDRNPDNPEAGMYPSS